MAHNKLIMLCFCVMAAAAISPIKAQAPFPSEPESVSKLVNFPNWMAGAWIAVDGLMWTEEYWTAERGGIMLGAARSGKGDVLHIWEQTQIRAGSDGKLAFFAMPRGSQPTEFPLIEQSATSVTFANAAHDYPQRIRYWREGSGLKAEISLMDGSKAFGWSYQPLGEAQAGGEARAGPL